MPSIGNRGLCKYEDKFFTNGIGSVSFSVMFHDLSAVADIAEKLAPVIKISAAGLAYRIRTNAPHRTGTLREGIKASSHAERSATPGKIVYDVVFDAAFNDSFVKVAKDGTRYYYPASQEYGFRKVNSGRVPGLYYMRNSSVEYYAEHRDRVAAGVENVLEEL